MDFLIFSCSNQHLCVLLILLISHCTPINSWQYQWSPNSHSALQGMESGIQVFRRTLDQNDHFKVISAHDDWMLVGGLNVVHNISLNDLQVMDSIKWESDESDINTCMRKQKTRQECQNYIRVIVPKNHKTLFICGTNAFKPKCRTYVKGVGEYKSKREEAGIAKCPYDPKQNSTSIYTGGKFYSATFSDFSARDPLIIESKVRTVQFDSKWLNDPNFVSSFEKDDKVFFLFREAAIENINCGKATFSRVARVCKQDRGGETILQEKWTSFLKARLNCSISGNYPFHFNEIQGSTELGQGNYRPVPDSGDRSSMFYGVFTTNENSISGSAICAFSHADIIAAFQGKFKGQESALHNWLAVRDEKVPFPRPDTCFNDSRTVPDKTLAFIKDYPLMDRAVPSRGGAPILVHVSFTSRFTVVAVDWQVWSGKGRYYDVIFVGTTDGRVIKAINKGETSKIETVIIEDIQVFPDKAPVVNLKLYKGNHISEKLVVISEKDIVAIPLHRCHEKTSCHECVALQDPYCSWAENQCVNSERGIQNIQEGKDESCGPLPPFGVSKPTTTTTIRHIQPPVKTPCDCSKVNSGGSNTGTKELPNEIPNQNVYPNIPDENNVIKGGAGRVGEAVETREGEVTASTLAIALVVAIVLSLVLGFLIGYKVSSCRGSRDIETPYLDRNIAIQKSKNRLSSSTGENVYFNTDSTLQKQLNYVVNVNKNGKLNSCVETKPVQKSNKVYL